MVQEAVITQIIPSASVEEVFRIMHEKPAMMVEYHKQLGSELISVGSWSGNQRTIKYRLKVKLPALLKSFIQVDMVTMEEVQTITWHENGLFGYTIECVPALQLPGGERFSSPAVFDVLQQGPDTHIACTVRCSATIWGMSGAIEAMMLVEAKKTLTALLEFAAAYFDQHSSGSEAAVAQPDTPSQPPVSVVSADTLDSADATSVPEPESGRSTPAEPSAEPASPASARIEPADEAFFDACEPLDHREVIRHLQALEHATKENAHTCLTSLVEARVLSRRLDALQDSIDRFAHTAREPPLPRYTINATSATFVSGVLIGAALAVGVMFACDMRKR